MIHINFILKIRDGIVPSRLSSKGRTRFFEEVFGRTISKSSVRRFQDETRRFKFSFQKLRTKSYGDETDGIIDLSQEKCFTDIEAVVFL